jgi:hypothetical protein
VDTAREVTHSTNSNSSEGITASIELSVGTGRLRFQRFANGPLGAGNVSRLHQNGEFAGLNGEDLGELVVHRELARGNAGCFERCESGAEGDGIVAAPNGNGQFVAARIFGIAQMRRTRCNKIDAAIGADFESGAIFNAAFGAEHMPHSIA